MKFFLTTSIKKVLGKLIDVLKSFDKSEMFWILEDF
jgi:hypothetical protein